MICKVYKTFLNESWEAQPASPEGCSMESTVASDTVGYFYNFVPNECTKDRKLRYLNEVKPLYCYTALLESFLCAINF